MFKWLEAFFGFPEAIQETRDNVQTTLTVRKTSPEFAEIASYVGRAPVANELRRLRKKRFGQVGRLPTPSVSKSQAKRIEVQSKPEPVPTKPDHSVSDMVTGAVIGAALSHAFESSRSRDDSSSSSDWGSSSLSDSGSYSSGGGDSGGGGSSGSFGGDD